ncbi:sensor histidine kinase [Paenibacillus marinisediminis]
MMVKRFLYRLIPAKLKYRFFFALILFVLIPIAAIHIYQYRMMENLIKERVSQLNDNQLEQIGNSFEGMKTKILMSMLTLEKDRTVMSILQHPGKYDELQRNNIIEDRYKQLQQYVYSSYVHFTLADFHGNRYMSYKTEHNEPLDEIMPKAQLAELLSSDSSYFLLLDKKASASLWNNAPLFTLYSVAKDEHHEPYGMLRIRVDYNEWFKSAAREISSGQSFLLTDSGGTVIARTSSGVTVQSDIFQKLISQLSNGQNISYYMDKKTNSLIDIRYLSSLQWYVINVFPLDIFLGDLKAMRNQVLITLYIMIGVFTLFTFIISASVTRPLQKLQKTMKEMAKHNLQVHIPENAHKGEILGLNQAFNRMVQDINDLVDRLKIEERQKEAIHLQMLLNQINPHFLLNTLNSIKWIALEQKNDTISEICLSLGKLLESSLNSDVELIHLKGELELLRAYVHIQKFRYDQLFDIFYDVDQTLEYALVPKLGLQPLVENAIHHGLSHMESGGIIMIRIYKEKNKLTIEVEDNGIGLHKPKSILPIRNRKGIGLANLRERCRLLFRKDADIQLISLTPGTRVKLTIPLLVSIPYALEGMLHVEGSDR